MKLEINLDEKTSLMLLLKRKIQEGLDIHKPGLRRTLGPAIESRVLNVILDKLVEEAIKGEKI